MRPNIIFFLIDGLRSEQFYENNNIAQTHKQLVTHLEKKMLELEKDNLSEYDEEISDEEMQKISSELKRLGYMES